jgi:hypothetical protein
LIKRSRGHSVLNVDTGHMALARMIEICLNSGDATSLGDLLPELLEAFGESIKRKATEDELFASKDLFWLKHNFFAKYEYQGAAGLQNALNKMSKEAVEYFWRRANWLDQKTGFKIGDVTAIQSYCRDADAIFCINGYGYNPLNEKTVFVPMWTALKAGGCLIIVSSYMGPTVKEFLNWGRNKSTQNTLATMTQSGRCAFEKVEQTLGKKANLELPALGFFDFLSGQSTVFKSASAALATDMFTASLESRHTEGGTAIDEVTVKLVFRKKGEPDVT